MNRGKYNLPDIPSNALKSITDMTGKVWKLAVIEETRIHEVKTLGYAYVSEDKSKALSGFYSGGVTGAGLGWGYSLDEKLLSGENKYSFIEFVD